jgi:hypothetical protein
MVARILIFSWLFVSVVFAGEGGSGGGRRELRFGVDGGEGLFCFGISGGGGPSFSRGGFMAGNEDI